MAALRSAGSYDHVFGGTTWRPPGYQTIRQQEVAQRVDARLREQGLPPRRRLADAAASLPASAPAAEARAPQVIREDRPKLSWAGSETTRWCGRSGARFVFGVVPVAQAAGMATQAGGIFVAVARDEAGIATIISVRSYGTGDERYPRWLDAAIERGATEVHVHRLATDDASRAAIIADLCDPDKPRRAVATAA